MPSPSSTPTSTSISERARLAQPVDLSSWFVHYASSDLVSAGLPEEALLKVQDPAVPLDERWRLIEPHWAAVRYTGYGRALLLAARDLFGIEDINRDTYRELSAKLAASNHEGWYDYVLKQRANIAISVLDQLFVFDPTPLPELDRRFFAPAWKANSYILVSTLGELRMLEATSGRQIHSLDDLVAAMDHEIGQAVAAGIAGIKVSVAYDRSLDFDKVARATRSASSTG